MEQLHVGQRVAGSRHTHIAHLEIDTGAELEQAVQQVNLETQHTVCIRRVRAAALQQGTDTGTEEGELTLPESEVDFQTHVTLQCGIYASECVKVILTNLRVAWTTCSAHIQQCHVEAEVSGHMYIEEEVQSKVGVEGGTHTEAAALVDGEPVGVLQLTGVFHAFGIGIQFLFILVQTEEFLQGCTEWRHLVSKGVTCLHIEGEFSLGSAYHHIEGTLQLNTFRIFRLADGEVPVGGTCLVVAVFFLVVLQLKVDRNKSFNVESDGAGTAGGGLCCLIAFTGCVASETCLPCQFIQFLGHIGTGEQGGSSMDAA